MAAARNSVLLVEDEDNIALALEILIGRCGFRLRRADCATQALAELERDVPDLVVLDVMLGDGSGYDICQHIRRTGAFADTKVLMISAAGHMAERKALALGADAFFTKPFDTTELIGKIRSLLGEVPA